MLFDLRSGKRRRVVQVVYTLLAASFLIGFVIFGVGSNGVGGIGDLLSGDSGGDSAAASQYSAQIDQAEKQLRKDPKDQQALLDLARYRYLSGISQVDTSDPNNPQPTDETRSEWGLALDAWEKYLQTDPKQPDPTVAGQMVGAYQLLGDAEGAADAQRIIAEKQPNSANYAQLAFFLYSAGDIDAGDEAADKAVAEASGSQAKKLEKQLADISQQAATLAKQAKAGTKQGGAGSLQNPLGGLDTGTVPPASP